MPVLLVAGEGRDVGICEFYVSNLALEGNLYYKTRRETIQRSRRYELKRITTLVFQFVFQHDLLSKDRYILRFLSEKKGDLPSQWRGFLLCKRNFPEVW